MTGLFSYFLGGLLPLPPPDGLPGFLLGQFGFGVFAMFYLLVFVVGGVNKSIKISPGVF